MCHWKHTCIWICSLYEPRHVKHFLSVEMLRTWILVACFLMSWLIFLKISLVTLTLLMSTRCMGIKPSLQPSLTTIRLRCWLLPTAADTLCAPPTSAVTQSYWAMRYFLFHKFPSFEHVLARAFSKPVSYVKYLCLFLQEAFSNPKSKWNGSLPALLPWIHTVNARVLTQSKLSLFCSISIWSYLFPCLCYRIYISSCICPGWLYSRIYHLHIKSI